MTDTNEPFTKQLHVLPYDETRKALAHGVENYRGGGTHDGPYAWLTRNRARVSWQGEWAYIYYRTHTRISLTIEIPDPSSDTPIAVTGSGNENKPGDPWETAFNSALSQLLDLLAQRLTEAKRSDEAPRLLNALGFD